MRLHDRSTGTRELQAHYSESGDIRNLPVRLGGGEDEIHNQSFIFRSRRGRIQVVQTSIV